MCITVLEQSASSARADHTGELLSIVAIQRAVVSSADCLHVVEESIIRTLLTAGAWNSLRVPVHTLVRRAMVVGVCGHEVAIVLHSPVSWAVDFGWDHDHCDSCGGVAQSTRNVVVFNTGQ